MKRKVFFVFFLAFLFSPSTPSPARLLHRTRNIWRGMGGIGGKKETETARRDSPVYFPQGDQLLAGGNFCYPKPSFHLRLGRRLGPPLIH